LIQNKSLVNSIFAAFGNKAGATSLEIPAGGSYEPTVTPIDSVNIINPAGAGTTAAAVVEGLDPNYNFEDDTDE
jgi:hypothetical protein